MKVLLAAAALLVPIVVAGSDDAHLGGELTDAGGLEDTEVQEMAALDFDGDEEGDRELGKKKKEKKDKKRKKMKDKKKDKKKKKKEVEKRTKKAVKANPKKEKKTKTKGGPNFSTSCQKFKYSVKESDIADALAGTNTTVTAFTVPLYDKKSIVGHWQAALVPVGGLLAGPVRSPCSLVSPIWFQCVSESACLPALPESHIFLFCSSRRFV